MVVVDDLKADRILVLCQVPVAHKERVAKIQIKNPQQQAVNLAVSGGREEREDRGTTQRTKKKGEKRKEGSKADYKNKSQKTISTGTEPNPRRQFKVKKKTKEKGHGGGVGMGRRAG